MDVSVRALKRPRVRGWHLALGAILLLALGLRLHGIHDPLLDHPGWRQGDTAAIARNFATLDANPFQPQVDYDGPPPNYVELELQVVPFLAALLYKVFGVHPVFGRLISIAFSAGTVGVVAYFARFLFGSPIAGLAAALALAIAPGSIYYGRTFTPDTAMVFFLTAALYWTARYLLTAEPSNWRSLWPPAALTALAILAKPVALVALVPIAAMALARFGLLGTVRRAQTWVFLAIAVLPFVAYDAYAGAIAEWHWSSGITRLHVLPALFAAFGSPAALAAKWQSFTDALAMLPATMLGGVEYWLAILAIFVPPPARARPLLYGWLAGALAYTFIVVTVERVDYYLYLLLPLAALGIGRLAAAAAIIVPPIGAARAAAAVAVLAGAAFVLRDNLAAIAPYYRWNPAVYVAARALDQSLAPHALVVMGHYDPSVLYYINRKGWEEDPLLWTPFDEESAIRKGARYFIAVEPRRLARNRDLSEWLARFPLDSRGRWPVYHTDPALTLPGAEDRWQEYRRIELGL
ncbi:MAG: glycosyltransferase family 39 protein [Vulcanimicrobiaceae bacterium]